MRPCARRRPVSPAPRRQRNDGQMTASQRPVPPPVDDRPGVVPHPAWRLRAAGAESFTANLIEEVPVALIYNGISHAVMLASPGDLEDFALGFSLSEGILETPQELLDLELAPAGEGVE